MSNTFVINGEILKEFIGSIAVMGTWNAILHIDPVNRFAYLRCTIQEVPA